MTVSRKLFLTIASFIVAMGLVFALLTQLVVMGILHYMADVDRDEEIRVLSAQFADYYDQHQSWNDVQQLRVNEENWNRYRDASFVLVSPDQNQLYAAGTAGFETVKRLGLQSEVQLHGATIAHLYYYDREVSKFSVMRLGINSSVTLFLTACTVIFVLLSLLVAYKVSKRLTAPLKVLLPVIDRLGKGDFGVQAPVRTQDEFGKIANAFNDMSVQLHRAEDLRRNLVADVAHELRTPITIIRGKLELVQQGGTAIEPESLLPLQDELIRLTRLVDDLHQLSLAEANKLSLDLKTTAILDLLTRVIEHVSIDAEMKGIEITLSSSDSVHATMIQADSHRLTQVFLNLIVNAVRYTPSGGQVHITVEEEPAKNAGSNMLRVSIADTGVGIEPEHLPFLFNRFYRTDEARTRNQGGMGLGLAIAKQFVLAHNGTIEVESIPGQGTTFIIRLPVLL